LLTEPSVQPGETEGLVSNDGAASKQSGSDGAAVSTVTDATPRTSATEK
jgi:hypothetical protein